MPQSRPSNADRKRQLPAAKQPQASSRRHTEGSLTQSNHSMLGAKEIPTTEFCKESQSQKGLSLVFQELAKAFVRRLIADTTQDSSAVGDLTERCLSELSNDNIEAIGQFQGQIGAPHRFKGDSPVSVLEYMEISHRYYIYHHTDLDVMKTEDAFQSLFRRVEKLSRPIGHGDLERKSQESVMEIVEDSMAAEAGDKFYLPTLLETGHGEPPVAPATSYDPLGMAAFQYPTKRMSSGC
ncbi:hypothetical protein S7711_11522 [Stachybotrys chartarum IBT 7711]|uniref:Uncharacterized protein n=1 Tax=Stachybotrys chartarum (strain CBS 109288 / IBT 7711) TaxID=1280523 RepID=A0A084BAB3_STACB|nr:hypothetical protein S7711_11522 [Stachybotrys chartarum IBT 7711]